MRKMGASDAVVPVPPPRKRKVGTPLASKPRELAARAVHVPSGFLVQNGTTGRAALIGGGCDDDGEAPADAAMVREARHEDCTLVAWYRSLRAPRALEGRYDSHHRTAGIAGRTRRR